MVATVSDVHDPAGSSSDQTQHETGPVRLAHLDAQIQALILMKETGPKSAAWHRARVRMLWRLQHQVAELRAISCPHSHGVDLQ